jgi:hypothetical protein
MASFVNLTPLVDLFDHLFVILMVLFVKSGFLFVKLMPPFVNLGLWFVVSPASFVNLRPLFVDFSTMFVKWRLPSLNLLSASPGSSAQINLFNTLPSRAIPLRMLSTLALPKLMRSLLSD